MCTAKDYQAMAKQVQDLKHQVDTLNERLTIAHKHNAELNAVLSRSMRLNAELRRAKWGRPEDDRGPLE